MTTLHRILLFGGFAVLLAACGGDEKSSAMKAFTQPTAQVFKQETTLSGKVSNQKGLIKSGTIKAVDLKGNVLATATVGKDGQYRIKIPAATALPIELKFFPEDNSQGAEAMVAVVAYASMTGYDINDLTTKIAKKAKQLGGYTHRNIVLASESMVHVPDANKTTTGFRGDPTKQYGGWH
jgi:hypothetical protein